MGKFGDTVAQIMQASFKLYFKICSKDFFQTLQLDAGQ